MHEAPFKTGKQNMKAVFGFNVFDQQFIGLWQMRQFPAAG